MSNKILIKFIWLAFFSVLFIACAKQVAINGGPKDTTPPRIVEAFPQNGSVNFNEDFIYVKFDEYIKLNSLNQKLIVSPPMEEDPEIIIKGKGIKIYLNLNTLDENTTYSLNFNDAIADNNENNSLHSYVYAFSTGKDIDSLSFSGYVLDAYTKKPVEDIWIILHDNMIDSAIQTMIPAYITKVDKDGNFLIPFVRDNDYKIYALKDNNYNYMFDIPDEAIAFMDTVYNPSVEIVTSTDTSQYDTHTYKNTPANIELLIFSENKQSQFIKSSERNKLNYMELVFNATQYEDFSVNIPQDEKAIIFAKENPDTVKIWLSNTELIEKDSVVAIIEFIDPVFTDSIRQDTVFFRNTDIINADSLVSININSKKEPHKELMLKMSSPYLSFDKSKIIIERLSDTLYSPIQFVIVKDSLDPLCLKIVAEFIEKSEYRIICQEEFITDINNLVNILDTFDVSVVSSLEYGNLNLSFVDKTKTYIVQLLNGENIVSELVTSNGLVEFGFLPPANYRIRVIEDMNSNKRWDTGDYSKKLQAEPVYYYPEEYEIRSNWNHEIEWNPVTNISNKE